MKAVDPYKVKMFKRDPFGEKSPLEGKLVAVLDGKFSSRGLQLIPQPSRAICRGQVHELIITGKMAYPGDKVDSIAYLGFVEFENGGVMVSGDELMVDGEVIGTICGFDETHMPNHLNIVIQGERVSGLERNLRVGQTFRFVKKR